MKAGEFFGEMGLISGRRRTATVSAGKDCVLIETPRRSMLKLIGLGRVGAPNDRPKRRSSAP